MVNPHPHPTLSLVVGKDGRTTSDGDVALGLMRGEKWAVVETWRRFAPMVLLLAKRTLGSQAEAEDIGQVVFCSVYRKIRQLREPSALRSYIYGFALSALRTELRRRKVRAWLRFEKPEVLSQRSSHTMDMESRDLLRRFQALLDRLSPRDRMVFVLRRMEAMTIEEISAAMKLSDSTVKRSMAEANRRLSRWIDGDPSLAGLFHAERSEP